MVSLWDMLTLLSACSAFGAAMAAAAFQGGGGARFVAGVLLGAALGLLAMAAAQVAGNRAFRHFRLEDDSPRANAGLRVLYLAKFTWLLVAPFLSFWMTDSALRIAFR
jgi:hypothetical protein